MSTLAAPVATARTPAPTHAALRRAQVALVVGAAAAVVLAATVLFVTTTSDGPFRHTGDYVLTADGFPYVLALLVLLASLRTLQHGRDGRLGRVGLALAGLGCTALLVVFVHGLATASESSLGPTYVVASLATIVGVICFAAGSWRTGLLPRWLLGLWVVAWVVGSMLPILGPGPLLLAAVYLAMATVLPRRAAGDAAARYRARRARRSRALVSAVACSGSRVTWIRSTDFTPRKQSQSAGPTRRGSPSAGSSRRPSRSTARRTRASSACSRVSTAR
jgi:hypothetical protein